MTNEDIPRPKSWGFVATPKRFDFPPPKNKEKSCRTIAIELKNSMTILEARQFIDRKIRECYESKDVFTRWKWEGVLIEFNALPQCPNNYYPPALKATYPI